MQTYLNDPKLKTDFLAEIRRHQKADRIIQGTYGNNNDDFKGCAVGCSIHSLNIIKGKTIPTNRHAAYETELGIPRQLAHLEDRIFEGLPVTDAKQWPLRFATAIPVGADLSMVIPQLMLWLLSDEKCGGLQYATSERSKQAIQTVIDLYTRKLAGEAVTDDEWRAAAAGAADAYSYYAYAVAYDAAADDAAYAAAYARKTTKQKQDRFSDIADKLIELLEATGKAS